MADVDLNTTCLTRRWLKNTQRNKASLQWAISSGASLHLSASVLKIFYFFLPWCLRWCIHRSLSLPWPTAHWPGLWNNTDVALKLLRSRQKDTEINSNFSLHKNWQPDSRKLHFLRHIRTRADLEREHNVKSSPALEFHAPTQLITYQTLFQPPHVSSANVLILERQLHQIQGNILSGIQALSATPCTRASQIHFARCRHVENTFGSTILTMTSWYARNLKACATVWSTLIVSGQEEEEEE